MCVGACGCVQLCGSVCAYVEAHSNTPESTHFTSFKKLHCSREGLGHM